jgi:hypothetical protein
VGCLCSAIFYIFADFYYIRSKSASLKLLKKSQINQLLVGLRNCQISLPFSIYTCSIFFLHVGGFHIEYYGILINFCVDVFAVQILETAVIYFIVIL